VRRPPWYDEAVRRLVPGLALLAYGGAFAVAAFRGGVPAFDDHPGQFFRLWHALERSFPGGRWTADWNPDWWGGYPELQFYPPGFVLAGAAIRLLGLWQPSVETVYQLLCALVLLLPALATFALLAVLLEDGWLALPPAFLALTLSAGLPGGVEESMRWGMLTTRLALGLLPLLLLALRPWVEAGRRPVWAPPAAAAVVLAHPSAAPAAAAILALATLLVLARQPARRTAAEAAAILVLALALTAFWALPLVARRAWVVPLAWGQFSFAGFLGELRARPLLAGILLAVPLGWVAVALRRRAFPALVAVLPVATLAALALDLWLFRRGWSPLDPARLADAVVLSALWAGGLGVGTLVATLTRRRARGLARPAVALALIIVAALLPGPAGAEPNLTLWPGADKRPWPRLPELTRAHDLERLWGALRRDPDRVLFLTSALRLGHDPAWYAAHSHVLSLAPLFAEREIVNGTFTHPAPLAARFYTGSATPPPRLETLVEELDGQRLLGQPWDRVTPDAFETLARRLRVATVVVPTADVGRARFLGDRYVRADEAAGFTVLERRERPWPRLERITHRRYRVFVEPTGGVWIPTGIPAYPLWQVKSRRGVLETRVDPWGLLEFRVPLDVFEAELVYAEGWLEWAALGLTLAAGVSWPAWAFRARRG